MPHLGTHHYFSKFMNLYIYFHIVFELYIPNKTSCWNSSVLDSLNSHNSCFSHSYLVLLLDLLTVKKSEFYDFCLYFNLYLQSWFCQSLNHLNLLLKTWSASTVSFFFFNVMFSHNSKELPYSNSNYLYGLLYSYASACINLGCLYFLKVSNIYFIFLKYFWFWYVVVEITLVLTFQTKYHHPPSLTSIACSYKP